MANMIDKMFQFAQPQKAKNKWDITENSLGLTEGYGDKLNSALDGIFQKQLADTTNRAQESAQADGSFNPNVSQFYATQGARDAQAKGKVDAMGQARADEYNRFNARNAINNFDLQEGALALQREQYEDSKPGWLDDVLGVVKSVAPFVPLAEGGDVPEGNFGDVEDMHKQLKDIEGKMMAVENQLATTEDQAIVVKLKDLMDNLMSHKMALEMAINNSGKAVKGFADGGPIEESDSIPDSDDFNPNGGVIPNKAVNSTTEPNGDNTLIKAQPGEVIQSNPTGDLIGRDNLKLINNAGQMVNNMLEQKAIPGTPAFQNRPQAQPSGNGFGDIIEKVLGKKNFGGGAKPATAMAEGGMAGNIDDEINSFVEQLNQLRAKHQQMINAGSSPQDLAKIETDMENIAMHIKGLEAEKQRQGRQQQQQQQAPPQQGPAGQPQGFNAGGAISANQGGESGFAKAPVASGTGVGSNVPYQKKITIEEKPTGY
jgi:hypothetical protein